MIWAAIIFAAILFTLSYMYLPAVRFLRFLRDRETATAAVRTQPFSTTQIAGVRVDCYGSFSKTRSALILLPGLHPDGIDDRRFQTLADSCAAAGFLVIAPEMQEFRECKISGGTVDFIEHLIEALPGHFPPTVLDRLGMMGISYAVGPMVIAATRPAIRAKVEFLICVGGYYDLGHAVEFAMTGNHSANGLHHHSNPDPYARMVLSMNHLETLVSDPPLRSEIREYLALRLQLNENAARDREKLLSMEAAGFVNRLNENPSTASIAASEEILGSAKQILEDLSPSTHIAHLPDRIRMYLLHGRGDELVPYVETLEIENQLRRQGHKRVKTLITGKLGHMDPSQSAGLTDFLQLLQFTKAILSER